MRQSLLCSMVLLLGAELAFAQHWPASQGMYPAHPTAPYSLAHGNPGYYPTPGPAGYTSYQGPYTFPRHAPNYYPAGYAHYPNSYYPYYGNSQGYDHSYYPDGSDPHAYQVSDPEAYHGDLPLVEGEEVGFGHPAAPYYSPGIEVPPAALDERYHPSDLHQGPPLPFHPVRKDKLGWVSGQYLSSWIRPGNLPVPLVTTGIQDAPVPGAIGQPGTITLFGGDNLDFGMFHGFKGELGVWLDHENRYSIDVGGFVLFPQRINFAVASTPQGNPIIVRPVFDTINEVESGFLVSFPDLAAGSTAVEASSDLWGMELNGRCHTYCSRRFKVESLLGFRFLNLNESLTVTDRFQPLQPNAFTFLGDFIQPGDVLTDRDHFATTNRFYGMQVGGQLRWEMGHLNLDAVGLGVTRFHLNTFAKVALGLTDQNVTIAGDTTLISPTAGIQVAPGGILALPSNIGDHNRTVFGVVPEFGLNLGIDLTRHIRIRTGYSFLLWNAVVRPGDHIDRAINPAQVPSDQLFGLIAGPERPAFLFRDDAFWVHNFHFGLEFHR